MAKRGRKKKAKVSIDVAVVVMILVSILLAVLIYTKSGFLGEHLSPALGGIMGFIKYIIPVGTFAIAIYLAYDKDNIEAPCDKIGCSVFKNGQKIAIEDLSTYNLKLIWIVHQENGETYEKIYTEPLIFGYDNDINKDHFQSDDVMIVFKLYYDDTKEIVTSTVPLIKDGVDGRDGESWQYIFVRSNRYPFPDVDTLPDDDKEYGILNPSKWKKYDEERKEYISDDPNRTDNTKEYLGPDGSTWIDEHQGVDEYHKYEYQSYRKWDANKKEWGILSTNIIF